jgi:hypothetical protein
MATETVKKLFVSMDCERRRLFGMERAKPLKTAAGRLQTYVFRNDFNDVGRITNGFGKVVHLGCRDPKKRNQTRYTDLAENINTEFWVPNGPEQGHLTRFAASQSSRPVRPAGVRRLRTCLRAGGFRVAREWPGEGRRFPFRGRSGLLSFVRERRRRGTYR